VSGLALNLHAQPADTVVPAANLAPLSSFHDQGIVRRDSCILDEPTRAQEGIGLLVCGEGNLKVDRGAASGGPDKIQRGEQ